MRSTVWSQIGLGMLQEALDGDLAARVFGLLQAADTGSHQRRYGERSRQRLDLAVLAFFQSFRKVYVGEQTMHSSKVRLHDAMWHMIRGLPCQHIARGTKPAMWGPLREAQPKLMLTSLCLLQWERDGEW